MRLTDAEVTYIRENIRRRSDELPNVYRTIREDPDFRIWLEALTIKLLETFKTRYSKDPNPQPES
jgi:hypothetical protein